MVDRDWIHKIVKEIDEREDKAILDTKWRLTRIELIREQERFIWKDICDHVKEAVSYLQSSTQKERLTLDIKSRDKLKLIHSGYAIMTVKFRPLAIGNALKWSIRYLDERNSNREHGQFGIAFSDLDVVFQNDKGWHKNSEQVAKFFVEKCMRGRSQSD